MTTSVAPGIPFAISSCRSRGATASWRPQRTRVGHAMVGSKGRLSTRQPDRKSTRLNSSHTEIYTLSLHDALPIYLLVPIQGCDGIMAAAKDQGRARDGREQRQAVDPTARSEEHTSELQSHRDLHSFPTRRSSDLSPRADPGVRRHHGGRKGPGSGTRWSGAKAGCRPDS